MAEAQYITNRLTLQEGAEAYRILKAKLTEEGVFQPAYLYYFSLSISLFIIFFVLLYLLTITRSLLLFLFLTVAFSFITIQIAGLVHDAGHRAIFRSTAANTIFGHFLGAFLGMGFEQWRVKHNAHHAHSNDEDDPDIHLPVISLNREIAQEKKGISRFLVGYQHIIYYFLGTLVIFSTRLNNIYYIKKKFQPYFIWHIPVYIAGLAVWYTFPFFLFGFSRGLLFLIISNALEGIYMFQVFAPNHKGMPYIKKDVKFSFIEQQVRTSRNLYANPITDFVYLGLNYQIEHHLFPGCPRNKLHKTQKLVQKTCKKLGLEYTQVGIIETNRIILSELKSVADAMRRGEVRKAVT